MCVYLDRREERERERERERKNRRLKRWTEGIRMQKKRVRYVNYSSHTLKRKVEKRLPYV